MAASFYYLFGCTWKPPIGGFCVQGAIFRGVFVAFGFRTLAFSVLFRKCREKSKLAERNPFFGNKTAGQRSSKQGSGRQCSDFPALPELPDGSMRQILEPSSTPPFSGKEAAGGGVAAIQCVRHVWNLPLTSGFSTSSTGLFID